MQYIKFTYIDSITGISVAVDPSLNGTKFPEVPGIEFVWARESAYPTNTPEFFGTCPDGSNTKMDGVLGVFTKADWEQMQADEMRTRPPVFPDSIPAFILQVDNDTDSLIKSVIGERGGEYELAENEATAYKAAGYTGTVPSSVQAWATAKGWTATQATDSILTAATGWRTAQAALRAARLLHKEQASVAVDAAELDTIKTQWNDFLAALKTSLGVEGK
tara:strand:+ start:1169 stop:1825 length:657 start_codon:yes stop_codon:yes gene_type:complete